MIVVNEADVGVLEEVVAGGCVVEVGVGVDDVDGVFVTTDDEDVVGGVLVGVCCCEVDGVRDTGEEVEIDVEDVGSGEEVVIVELEDIVNCLNLRSLGRLKPGSTYEK